MNSELKSRATELAMPASIHADDRATWPPELLEFVDPEVLRWDVDGLDGLDEYRERVAVQLAAEALGDTFLFAYAAVHWLAAQVPFDSREGRVLDELSSALFGLLEDSVAETLRIAPVVQAAMPYGSGAELLAHVRAQLAKEGSDGAGPTC